MKTKNIAVLSCDIVSSTQYTPKVFKDLLEVIKEEFAIISGMYPTQKVLFAMSRGDSFQGIVEDSASALKIALHLKAGIMKFGSETVQSKAVTNADVRISIGIGTADYNENSIAESNGEAFHFSGRTLDKMKGESTKLTLTTSRKEVNEEFKVSFKFLDSVTDRWSISSAEVVYYLLKGYTEQQIADRLDRSQAAINLRKKAAGWEEIQLLLNRYEQVAKMYFV
ncbi:hypothetical protein ATE92_2289 [Ulvibacter sp. MAR_2010_11]|uniref:hypothetical protein n=1 Tax=Ulvibacter sp. MAR_2010_11 TaxID=1250229 RepID=UPI000C2C0EB1|nr:hypothetical protein [Ulvibacter sp. MAR_2010_11]PKA84119.1 hypothetical protein ATE92_2289 [Ulvibacter sp. MAR_2010_11]